MSMEQQRALIAAENPAAPMEQLWRPLSHRAWELSHEQARQVLTALTLPDVFAWGWATTPGQAKHWALEAGVEFSDDQQAAAAAAGAGLPKVTKELLARLLKIADDRYLSFLDLVEDARSGSVAALALAEKNASKTSWYEDAAGAFIDLRCPYVQVYRLAARQTKLSVRFDPVGGAFVDVSARDRSRSKDADLAVVLPPVNGCSKVLLVSHKYARVSGGHQDNQNADAHKYLEYASKAAGSSIPELTELVRTRTGDPERLVSWEPALVADGSYFTALAEAGPQVRNGQTVFVGTTDHLVARVNEYVASHLAGAVVDPHASLCLVPALAESGAA